MSKLRIKLAKMIEAQFLEQDGKVVKVDPDDLDPAQGWYRTSHHADCYRWEGMAGWSFEAGSILAISLYGADTMTSMVKNGIVLTKDRETSYDVHAREP